MVAIVSQKREAIRRAVLDMYTAVAGAPQARYHFPIGRNACAALGYPPEMLAPLPEPALESFAGVGFPFAADVIREGDHVLDVGSGSGTDALICARLVGPRGRVYALDMTPDMRAKLAASAAAAGFDNVEVLAGEAESIPLPDASVDAVTTHGVLNLVPDKARAIAEIFRVLKPGGRLQIADIALARRVAERYRQDPQMWAECVVGAVEEERYLAMLRNVGFTAVERLRELDYFALSASDKTREVARLFNAHSVALRAVKPLDAGAAAPVPLGRAALDLGKELAGVAVAVFAWLACAGLPAVMAAFGAIGAGSLARHDILIPVYAAFMGFSVWVLWRNGRLRDQPGPFRLGAASAAFAIVTTWIALLGLAPPLVAFLSYAGVAGLVAASLWSFVLSRRPGSCVDEMVREAQLHEQRGPLARRLAGGAFAAVLCAGTLYAMYWSINGAGSG
jgi:ubiquinone/menaquinone biosynthesis C-methylase UbiE